MFVAPGLVAPFWPWSVTPLSCRVIGAIFCLDCAGLVVFTDPRWSTLKLVLQVEMIMVTLILVAALGAATEFDSHNAMTWLLGGGSLRSLPLCGYDHSRAQAVGIRPAGSVESCRDALRWRLSAFCVAED